MPDNHTENGNKPQIVHYMHFEKYWFYWIDEFEIKKYWRKGEGKCDDVHLVSEDIITERQCKEILRKMFPDKKIMKAIPYHRSPSPWGSRPAKITVDRKQMLKEKNAFRKELESFIE